jgi:hypothetical protein
MSLYQIKSGFASIRAAIRNDSFVMFVGLILEWTLEKWI